MVKHKRKNLFYKLSDCRNDFRKLRKKNLKLQKVELASADMMTKS